MADEPQLKKRILVPDDFTEDDRINLANNVIEFIKERTEKNLDIDGKKFHPYSDSYIKSADFKAAGKSKNDVNLRLTNEMMESMELIDQGSGFITIGYQEGTEANNKAVYNQRSDNGPSRMFVGIKDSDLERLIAKTRVDSDSGLNKVASSVTSKILKRFGLL